MISIMSRRVLQKAAQRSLTLVRKSKEEREILEIDDLIRFNLVVFNERELKYEQGNF